MEIAVDPIGTGSPSVGDYIKIAIDVIRRSGYKYEIGPWELQLNYQVLRR